MPGSLGKWAGPGQVLVAPEALVCRAGAAPGWETWFLWWCPVPVCSLCSEVKGSGQWSWELAVVIWQVGQSIGQSTGIELLPVEVERNGNNGDHWLLHPRQFLQLPSLLCLVSLPCLLFKKLFIQPQLSHRRSCSRYMCIFEFAHERGWVQRTPKLLLSWTSSFFFFLH